MAVVLLAQLFVEHSLAGSLILCGEDDLAESGFAKILRDARDSGGIGAELFEKLERLRKLRNPYVHPRVGMSGIMGRLVGSGLKHERELVDNDAWFAIETVVDFIREQSPDWAPPPTPMKGRAARARANVDDPTRE
jgi:hypothetical protein